MEVTFLNSFLFVYSITGFIGTSTLAYSYPRTRVLVTLNEIITFIVLCFVVLVFSVLFHSENPVQPEQGTILTIPVTLAVYLLIFFFILFSVRLIQPSTPATLSTIHSMFTFQVLIYFVGLGIFGGYLFVLNVNMLFFLGASGVVFTKILDIAGDLRGKIRGILLSKEGFWSRYDGFGDIVGDSMMKLIIFTVIMEYIFKNDNLKGIYHPLGLLPLHFDSEGVMAALFHILPTLSVAILSLFMSLQLNINLTALFSLVFLSTYGYCMYGFGISSCIAFLYFISLTSTFICQVLPIRHSIAVMRNKVLANVFIPLFFTVITCLCLAYWHDSLKKTEEPKYFLIAIIVLVSVIDFSCTGFDVFSGIQEDKEKELVYEECDNFGNSYKNFTRLLTTLFIMNYGYQASLGEKESWGWKLPLAVGELWYSWAHILVGFFLMAILAVIAGAIIFSFSRVLSGYDFTPNLNFLIQFAALSGALGVAMATILISPFRARFFHPHSIIPIILFTSLQGSFADNIKKAFELNNQQIRRTLFYEFMANRGRTTRESKDIYRQYSTFLQKGDQKNSETFFEDNLLRTQILEFEDYFLERYREIVFPDLIGDFTKDVLSPLLILAGLLLVAEPVFAVT